MGGVLQRIKDNHNQYVFIQSIENSNNCNNPMAMDIIIKYQHNNTFLGHIFWKSLEYENIQILNMLMNISTFNQYIYDNFNQFGNWELFKKLCSTRKIHALEFLIKNHIINIMHAYAIYRTALHWGILSLFKLIYNYCVDNYHITYNYLAIVHSCEYNYLDIFEYAVSQIMDDQALYKTAIECAIKYDNVMAANILLKYHFVEYCTSPHNALYVYTTLKIHNSINLWHIFAWKSIHIYKISALCDSSKQSKIDDEIWKNAINIVDQCDKMQISDCEKEVIDAIYSIGFDAVSTFIISQYMYNSYNEYYRQKYEQYLYKYICTYTNICA